MKKPRVILHIIMENENNVSSIKEALEGVDYNVSFAVDREETLRISEQEDFNILVLEPNMTRWAWMNVLIKTKLKHADVPIVLYCPEINLESDFLCISQEASVFVVNNSGTLKEKLGEIIKAKEKAKKRVLFVDDDPNVLDGYRRILHKTPWELITVASGEEALEVLQKEHVDLVVADIKMPHMHGIELISRIRENHKELPIAICSAYSGMEDDDTLHFHEIAEFMTKPLDAGTLKAKVEQLLS